MAGLRRVGLHRRFHAQGTMSRLDWLLYAMYVAKGLKDHACSLSYLASHHPQSLVLQYSRSANRGLRSFFFLPLILFSDHVERICF